MCGLLFAVYLSPCSFADSPAHPLCFDFSVPVKTPLRAYKQGRSAGESKHPGNPKHKGNPTNIDATESGRFTHSGGGIWGSALGKVELPIQRVYQLLLDHYTIKDPEKVKLRVLPEERPGYQDFHVVMLSFSKLFMKVNWEEQWAYAIAEGTSIDPKKIVVSYQKTTGTHFIPHLCGSIVLNSLGPKATQVYLYEEVNALGKRSPQDTVEGHLGTLHTLRQ